MPAVSLLTPTSSLAINAQTAAHPARTATPVAPQIINVEVQRGPDFGYVGITTRRKTLHVRIEGTGSTRDLLLEGARDMRAKAEAALERAALIEAAANTLPLARKA